MSCSVCFLRLYRDKAIFVGSKEIQLRIVMKINITRHTGFELLRVALGYSLYALVLE